MRRQRSSPAIWVISVTKGETAAECLEKLINHGSGKKGRTAIALEWKEGKKGEAVRRRGGKRMEMRGKPKPAKRSG